MVQKRNNLYKTVQEEKPVGSYNPIECPNTLLPVVSSKSILPSCPR